MRIGILLGPAAGADNALDDLVVQAGEAAQAGLHSAWLSQLFDVDALTALAVIGQKVPGIELGTAVVPTYPRHPMMLASQALTVQAACAGRLVLGIGLSHQVVIEGMFGYSFDRPAHHMAEYLQVLGPLVREGQVQFSGDTVKATPMSPMRVAGAAPFPILVAALGPRMLALAGELADGTVTWMVGPRTLDSHIVPSITRAAADAGRPPPRVSVGLPVCATADPEGAREAAARTFSIYGQLPSYRAMLDREGAEGPAQVAIVGDEEQVRAQVERIAEAGATDFSGAPFGSSEDRRRTREVLAGLARAQGGG